MLYGQYSLGIGSNEVTSTRNQFKCEISVKFGLFVSKPLLALVSLRMICNVNFQGPNVFRTAI